MKTMSLRAAALGALALGLVASAAQAAPATGLAGAIKTDTADAGQIEKVTYGWHRHCYWRYGYRHCHWGHRHWRGHYHGGHRRHWGYRDWRYGHLGWRTPSPF